MSVEIEGVKGYEYQYLATLYISLLYIEKDAVKIYVEDTEDAKILFNDGNVQKEIYLQSKKHNSNISFDNICLWLGHFGKRQTQDFLLSKIAKEECYAVFFSNGRCEDKVSLFLHDRNFESGNNGNFNNQYIEDFKHVFFNQQKANTQLDLKRKKCTINFFHTYTNEQIKSLLKKVSIVEQFTYEELLKQIGYLLNTHFVVRAKSIDYVIKLLDKCIRDGRDSSKDIVADIKIILNNYSQKILPDDFDYVEFPNQKEYEAILAEKNVLLLTGVPFSGKTSIAKFIAQKYAQNGYEIKQTSELDGDDGAFFFFNSYVDDKRLLLLEDPFGSIQLKPDKFECIQKIQKLIIEKTSFERKIIITTRKDILLSAFDVLKLDMCVLDGNNWHDLTLKDSNFAWNYWCRLYGNDSTSLRCFQRIENYIREEDAGIFLEIGEISYLKKHYLSLDILEKEDVKKILIDVHISSKSIMNKIKMEGADSIRAFISLGICCNTIRSVILDDLAYVLSDAEEKPAFIKRGKNIGVSFSFGKMDKEEPSFPQYDKKYKIDSSTLKILQQFEKRGYIFRNRISNAIYFAHPIFYYASILLLFDEIETQWEHDEIIMIGRHAISALSKNVNLCVLDILWYCIQNNSYLEDTAIELILESLNSVFPATKDKSVVLLEKLFDRISCEQQDILVNAIKNYEFDKYLLWHNNEPFINPCSEREMCWNFSSLLGVESSISLAEVKKIKNKQDISPKQVYDLLHSNLADDLSFDFLNIVMTYDESMIRERAIYLIFKNYGKTLNYVKKYLTDFDNCNVIFALFRGAIESWFKYSKQNQELIINYFLLQLQRVSVTIMAKNFLETFGDDYHENSLNWDLYNEEQTSKLWEVWCTIFSEFFLRIPPKYLRMDEAHMENTMNQAVKYVKDSRTLLSLFSSWNTWLIHSRCPTDYGLCVMEKILRYIPPNMQEREKLFCEMLTAQNTSIITSHIKHIIDNWEYTTKLEQQKTIDLFLTDRKDLIWIKAVALTRKYVPEKILYCIFKDNLFNKPIDELVKTLRETNLLENCLNVHCGYPQPLWWNGYHHSYYQRWDNVMCEVLKTNVLDKSFDISLREFIDCEYNHEQRFSKMREQIWQMILSDEKKRENTLAALIKVSATQVQTNKELWKKYLDACNPQEKSIAYQKIADFIEPLEYYQNGDAGILELFEKDIIFDHIYPLLKADTIILSICELTKQLQNKPDWIIEETEEKTCDFFETSITTMYDKYPPHMQLTNVIVKSVMKKINLNSEQLNKILEERRRTLIDIAHSKSESLDDQYDLNNWL